MQLVGTLPFINCCYSASDAAVKVDCDERKNCITRGVKTNRGCHGGITLLSFCEALATETLEQGLRGGLGQISDSAHLKVKIPKPPRRHCPLRPAALENLEPQDTNIKMSISEMCTSDCAADTCSSGKDVYCANSRSEIEFVALDVQALEQMKVSCSPEMFPCSKHERSVVIREPTLKGGKEIVRSSTDFDIQSKRNRSGQGSAGYDPCSIYDITEFSSEISNEPLANTRRSTSASGRLLGSTRESPAPPVPAEMAPFLEEPLLLVGPKLEWEGYVNARKLSSMKRRKRQQKMTPQEQKKMTRIVIGYTLAFFLLVIVTFYIVYFI